MFVRENRYFVLKHKDIDNYLNEKDRAILRDIALRLVKCRNRDHRPPLNCVVVEDDWPEYGEVWKMIEDREKREKIRKYFILKTQS